MRNNPNNCWRDSNQLCPRVSRILWVCSNHNYYPTIIYKCWSILVHNIYVLLCNPVCIFPLHLNLLQTSQIQAMHTCSQERWRNLTINSDSSILKLLSYSLKLVLSYLLFLLYLCHVQCDFWRMAYYIMFC